MSELPGQRTVYWFGEPWGVNGPAPICAPGYQIPVPIGKLCDGCDKRFESQGQGIRITGGPRGFVYYHIDCWMQETLGAVTDQVMRQIRGMVVVEGKCPVCGSLDVNIDAPLPLGQAECWDCKTIYEARPGGGRIVRNGRG